VLSLSSLIEFLLDMMRDPTTQNDYARDPNGTLAARGLSGVTAQDVHDVQPLLADHQGVSVSAGGAHAARSTLLDHSYGHHSAAQSAGHSGGHSAGYGGHYAADDPSPAIHHVTNAYEVDHSTVVRNVTQEYKQYATYKTYVTDNSVHADNGSTVIQDSFNQDNDGIDLKGATVTDSVIAGDDANGSGNETTTTVNEDSFNEDHSTTSVDSHDQVDSGNDDSTHHSQESNDDNHTSSDDHSSTYAPSHAASTASDDGGDALGAHHA
jgi:hypothetical protein